MEDDRQNARAAEAETEVQGTAGEVPPPTVDAPTAETNVKKTGGRRARRTEDRETATEGTTTTTATIDAVNDLTPKRRGPGKKTRRWKSQACPEDPPT
jgi:hypothetical protein